jgi:hypothetical protein
MSERKNDSDIPLPAIPLNYFEQHRQPWLPVVKMLVWLVLATEAYYLIFYLVEILGYFAHLITPGFRSPAGVGFPLLVEIPNMLGHLIILIGAVDARKVLNEGRRWMTSGVTLGMIFAIPVNIVVGLYRTGRYRYVYYYGSLYTISYLCNHIISGLGAIILPFFIWKFFRLSEVRELFCSQPEEQSSRHNP